MESYRVTGLGPECIVGRSEIGPAHSGIVAETRRYRPLKVLNTSINSDYGSKRHVSGAYQKRGTVKGAVRMRIRASIAFGSFDVLDQEKQYRAFRRFQFQPELFLHGGEDGRAGVGRIGVGGRRAAITRVFEVEIEAAIEAGFVDDFASAGGEIRCHIGASDADGVDDASHGLHAGAVVDGGAPRLAVRRFGWLRVEIRIARDAASFECAAHFDTAFGDCQIVDRAFAGFPANFEMEALFEKSTEHWAAHDGLARGARGARGNGVGVRVGADPVGGAFDGGAELSHGVHMAIGEVDVSETDENAKRVAVEFEISGGGSAIGVAVCALAGTAGGNAGTNFSGLAGFDRRDFKSQAGLG